MTNFADDEAVERLFASVRDLAPLIREYQAEADRIGRMPDALVEAFVELNLFRAGLPRYLGGLALEPVSLLRLIEEVGYIDGSAGWNVAIPCQGEGFASLLPGEIARGVYDTPRSCLAASLVAAGRAVAVPGGYRLNGRWGFASGIHHATWVGLAAIMFEGDTPIRTENGSLAARVFLIRREDASVLDTWHVGAMRGTGSADFTVTDLFVPDERSAPRPGGVAFHKNDDPLLRLGTILFGVNLACVALGIARCAIDGVIELASGKGGAPVRSSLKERQAAQYDVAKAQVLVESAKSYLFGLVSDMWQTLLRDEEWGPVGRRRVRQAAVHASETATVAVDMMYRVAGATALFESSPFERSLRDAHAIQSHILLQREVMEDVGRILFDMEPRIPIF